MLTSSSDKAARPIGLPLDDRGHTLPTGGADGNQPASLLRHREQLGQVGDDPSSRGGERVAQALHLSQRTLQRRLQEEGTSYQQLLDDTRRDMADQYLQQPGLTLLEVAYLLGFADPSNFFRAFRRWFGCTPNEYRARRQGRPG